LSFLLDTNAISEVRRPRPDEGYVDWLRAQDGDLLHMSVLSLGELRRGLLALPVGGRHASIEAWLSETLSLFGTRILPIDSKVAAIWAELTLAHRTAGRVVGTVDELIAATALAHNLIVVTHNVRHFEASGCQLLSPWSGA
jgi:predicted nucleic acid-binding protein